MVLKPNRLKPNTLRPNIKAALLGDPLKTLLLWSKSDIGK